MEMASRLIDLISKKNKLHVQHTFSSNQQKTNLHVQHAFLSFPCRCFARLQRCFVRDCQIFSDVQITTYPQLWGSKRRAWSSAVNWLLYADDVVIFSRSAKSLQIIFNKLESFCENAVLSVNLDKTKVMIFNNCGKSLNNYLFRYGADELENVKSESFWKL